MTNYTQSGYPKGLGMLSIPSQAPPTELNAPLLMRTDSDRNLSAEADPNPARKTRERILTRTVSKLQRILDIRFALRGV